MVDNGQLAIIGRERALVNALTKGLQRMLGGPPPSKATVAELRQHRSSAAIETRRGSRFEVQIIHDGEATGHIALVTVELIRFDG